MRSGLLAILLVSATILALVRPGGLTPARAEGPTFAIDAGVDGNGPTTVGTIENCVPVKSGDRFQMDVVVQDVTDLLAWEIFVDYDPTVVIVVDQDVKLFQQANAGSSVLDISAKLPDDSGFHSLSAFDSADPASPDSGSGVLARVTFEAVGAGDSPIRFGNRDYDSDGKLDRGSLLRKYVANPGPSPTPGADIIGDSNHDTFFDGARTDAQVVVDGDCPAGAVVAKATLVSPDGGGGTGASNGSSFPWLVVGGGAAAGVVALGSLLFLLSRRGTRRSSADA